MTNEEIFNKTKEIVSEERNKFQPCVIFLMIYVVCVCLWYKDIESSYLFLKSSMLCMSGTILGLDIYSCYFAKKKLTKKKKLENFNGTISILLFAGVLTVFYGYLNRMVMDSLVYVLGSYLVRFCVPVLLALSKKELELDVPNYVSQSLSLITVYMVLMIVNMLTLGIYNSIITPYITNSYVMYCDQFFPEA